ncbi:MAG: hypothetical protein PHV18_04220 [Lachnospiraceae bacterium]|nr:hypothetical protein [Lachnospiraceae bacterium]
MSVSGSKIVNLEDLKASHDSLSGRIDKLISDNMLFDGTQGKYRAAMKWWFLSHGVNVTTPAGLTALCNQWYELTRTEWNGWVEFSQPDGSAVSTGTKGGDNAGLVCVPSTNDEANQDDYAGHPLFAVVDCNYTVDATTMEPIITAIEGVTDNFERANPEKYVGVMQQAGWHWYDEKANIYIHGYSAEQQTGHDYCEPLPEAVRTSDNAMRPWVVHSKYMNHTESGKMTSYSGAIPTAYNISHNAEHTLAAATGTGYSGSSVIDYAFVQLMAFIKYGRMTLDGVLQGCINYNYQYFAQAAENGVKRVLLKPTEAANLIVGSSVIVGNYNGSSKDRGTGANYSITGQGGALVAAIESVNIDGTAYAAVYVDTTDTFNTAANGDNAEGTTIISTFHWINGSCDHILGPDGSPATPGNGRYAARLQGIEYMVGGYEVMSDVILKLYQDGENYYYEPYLVDRTANQATSITENYKASGLKSLQPETEKWEYIKKLAFAKGIFFGTNTTGGSSSTYTRDAFYKNAAVTGVREWLAFGALFSGSGNGGLSCLIGNLSLGPASWFFLARLSPNGNRGEWAA